ncbi:MAG: transglutaminase family protein [Caulobacteraceae bacterium]
MHRRALLQGAGTLVATVAFARQGWAAPEGDGWRSYDMVTEIDLTRPDAPAELWIPLPESRGGYQHASTCTFESTGKARVVRDARYGAQMLHVVWAEQGGPRTVKAVQTISTRDRTVDKAHLSASERAFWTAPVASLPTDGLVKTTAMKIALGHPEPRARLRAIYDWVVDNTFRDPATRGCGTGGIQNMLETGRLGGKCADINSLMVGLSRAAGIPARDVYGVRLGPSKYAKCLGASGDVSHAQHCRAEMWLDGEGWFPVDPADVRKVVLEEKIPVESAEVKSHRERLFGSWEMNWVAYNSATDVELPGAPKPPAEHFLMYPLAMTPAGEMDQLDPDTFRYRITSTVKAA